MALIDPWKNAIVSSKMVAPTTLTANPMNWRKHPSDQLDALEGLISTVGWVDRILVNRRSGHVIDGHARLELALRRGEPKVPVDYIDVDDEQEKLILATFDPIAMMAQTNTVLLEELVEQCDVDLSEMVDRLFPKGKAEGKSADSEDASFKTNPKITITLADPDEKDELVSAIVKAARRLRTEITIQ